MSGRDYVLIYLDGSRPSEVHRLSTKEADSFSDLCRSLGERVFLSAVASLDETAALMEDLKELEWYRNFHGRMMAEINASAPGTVFH